MKKGGKGGRAKEKEHDPSEHRYFSRRFNFSKISDKLVLRSHGFRATKRWSWARARATPVSTRLKAPPRFRHPFVSLFVSETFLKSPYGSTCFRSFLLMSPVFFFFSYILLFCWLCDKVFRSGNSISPGDQDTMPWNLISFFLFFFFFIYLSISKTTLFKLSGDSCTRCKLSEVYIRRISLKRGCSVTFARLHKNKKTECSLWIQVIYIFLGLGCENCNLQKKNVTVL